MKYSTRQRDRNDGGWITMKGGEGVEMINRGRDEKKRKMRMKKKRL